MNVIGTGTQLSFLCRLCGNIMPREEGFRILGHHTFHEKCYDLAEQRLSDFLLDILCLPEDEWEKWLEDEGFMG